MSPEIIRQPDDLHRRADPEAAFDEVERHVLYLNRDAARGEKDGVAEGVDGGAEDDEAEAVLQAVRGPGCEEGDGEAGGVDGDCLHLG